MGQRMEYNELWITVCMVLTQLIAQMLKNNQEELSKIKWTDSEANTDKGFSELACVFCVRSWDSIKNNYPECSDLTIRCKPSDIKISFLKGPKEVAKGKIELKSGKTPDIPGSAILSLDVNQPVIYCLRNESGKDFDIRYGQYHQFIQITDTATFQDRSPRPQVHFNMLTNTNSLLEYSNQPKIDWIPHYAKAAIKRTESSKYNSWQDELTSRIIKEFVKNTPIAELTRLHTLYNSTPAPEESAPPSAQ